MLLCCCRGAGVAVGGQDSDLGAREEYPPPPAREGVSCQAPLAGVTLVSAKQLKREQKGDDETRSEG